MCGIAGYLGAGDEQVLEKMATALHRRGPDDRGIFRDGQLGLAHTRLAVIDLSPLGHQPMKSSSGKTVIVFNGEIYNYRELKAEIEATDGYRFIGNSDTEVILALYECYGVEAFSKLNGMFAMALYDVQEEELILVRDRMGKKPLYWGEFHNTLLFGSELKALMCHPDFTKEIDLEAVKLYLTYEYVPTPFSIFKGVHKLEPGSYMRYKAGMPLRVERFWDITKKTRSDISFTDATKQFDAMMEQSVARRLLSDVPLGIFLSGGLDSSTIAYYAQRISSKQVKTFSIGFLNSDFDESPYAAKVAKTLGVSHTTEHFSAERCLELIPEVFSYLDEPIADSSIMPTYLLSAFTRKYVTVALAGDGSDELLAGYPTFKAEAFINLYKKIPQALRSGLVEPLVNSLPVSHSYLSLDFKLKRFLEGADSDDRYRHQRWLGAFSDIEAEQILGHSLNDAVNSPYRLLDQYFSPDDTREDFLQNLLWSYSRTYLMDELLVKVDRASMAHGLEVRTPFLDYTLVEFIQSLPYEYKFHKGTGKYLLKQTMEGKLPHEIIYRKKRGFAIPIGRWFRHELKPLLDDLLSRQAIEKFGILDFSIVERIKDEHERGVRDNRKKLWTIVVLQLWCEHWLTNTHE